MVVAFSGCDMGTTCFVGSGPVPFPFLTGAAGPLMPFFAAAEPGGQRGLIVGIGIGLVGGIAVFDNP